MKLKPKIFSDYLRRSTILIVRASFAPFPSAECLISFHNNAVIKVDCVVLKTDTYRQEEFSRRTQINLGDFQTWIVSREDLILSKLSWGKQSKSEMQLRDVRNLLSTDCDMEYLRSGAKKLEVDELLEEILGHE